MTAAVDAAAAAVAAVPAASIQPNLILYILLLARYVGNRLCSAGLGALQGRNGASPTPTRTKIMFVFVVLFAVCFLVVAVVLVIMMVMVTVKVAMKSITSW